MKTRLVGQLSLAAAAFQAVLLTLHAQAPALNALHVSAGGVIVDSTGKPVLLRGLNRSGTGSGNADANATDQDYGTQNQVLSMNLVRIFVNATWWNTNVQVPIANAPYQTYIDTLIQRAKKYGNYVLVLKAGNFPDPPCGSSGTSCPAPNQGDLNCQANSSLCLAQDTTGNNTDAAFTFWSSFAKKYAADPAILYDTWENMHGIDQGTWSDDQDQLIAVIRTYNPQALVFVEDTGSEFNAIAAGTLPDLSWSNVVWDFHLYNASTSSCTEPASPRYANWSQNMDSLVSFAQQSGHAVAFTEWGGCNDTDPYHTNIASYAAVHSIALVYFDNTNLINGSQLTATGTKVAPVYSALAAASSAPAPAITKVANAEGESSVIAPNTWVEIKGTNLAPPGDTRAAALSDLFENQMPHQLDGVSVAVNGNSAFVFYISPTQVNVLAPPNAMQGAVQVQVVNNGVAGAPFTAQSQAVSPSFFVLFPTSYVLAQHSDYSLLGPASLSSPGYTFTPAKPGETILLYANGFGATSTPIVSGSPSQGGTLSPLPVVTIGGMPATVKFAGLIYPGEFQMNVVVPNSLPDGDQTLTATYNGSTTQSGLLIDIQH